jgi:uncharacterized protein (TIGR02284 family)
METTGIRSTIRDLIQTCKDGQEGFATAAENIEDQQIRSLFVTYSQQRAEFIKELEAAARSVAGDDPADRGSIAGAIHRGWINLKSAISGKDKHSILAECERGEDSAVETYRKALEVANPGDILQIVQRQYAEIKAAHDKVKALRDACAPS